ncbi:MAG: hypothetical protein ACK2UK_18460 [Candidatus Promineifilaceae bacterium]
MARRLFPVIAIFLLVVSVLALSDARATRAAPAQRLEGNAARAFLVSEGLLDKMAVVEETPPQGRNFEEPQPYAALDAAEENLLGYAVAVEGNTAVVGAYSANVNGKLNQGAAYVFVRGTDGDWSQQQKLVAEDGAAFEYFGTAVTVEGNTAAVGAPLGGGGKGAVYTFTRSGGTWAQGQKLLADDGAASDQFGVAVALSGNNLAIGASLANIDGAADQGAVYIFARAGGTWSQAKKLSAADGAGGDQLGRKLTLDGTTLIAAARDAKVNGQAQQGAAYIFVRNGGVWSEQQKLIADDGAATDQFGYDVDLFEDTAIVGAIGANAGGHSNQGAAYVFTRTGTVWSQQQKLVADDGAQDDILGFSVAVFGDSALAGAPGATVNGVDQGAAYLFTREGTTWSQQQKLTPRNGEDDDIFGFALALDADTVVAGAPAADPEAISNAGKVYFSTRGPVPWLPLGNNVTSDGASIDNFGASVAVEGDTALAGAPFKEANGVVQSGAAYIFLRNGPIWVQQQRLTPADAAIADQFGIVTLQGDTAAISSPAASIGSNQGQGAVYIFTRTGSVWSEGQKLTASDGAKFDGFGIGLALDGNTLAIGSSNADVNGKSNQGALYVFTRSGGVWSQQQKLIANDGAVDDYLGHYLDLDGGTIVAGAFGATVNGADDQGAAYVFTRAGGVWSQKQKLTASDGGLSDRFGESVAIDGTTIVSGAPSDNVGNHANQGSAYIFTRVGGTWTEMQKLVASDGGSQEFFGLDLALGGDTLLVSAPLAVVSRQNQHGAAYVFRRLGNSWQQEQKLLPDPRTPGGRFGLGVALDGHRALVGAYDADVGANSSQGRIYFYEGPQGPPNPVPDELSLYLPIIQR